MGMFFSLLAWVAIAVMTTVYFPFDLIGYFLFWDRTHHWGHKYARFWAKSIVTLIPVWRVDVDARRLPSRGHFVIASNHESTADIIAHLHMPHHFKFISKRENFFVPSLGWAMMVAHYIPLVRGNKHSIARCMRKARWFLDNGVSVLFYPEGTRSPDGSVRPFKPGAFRLAIEAGVDVLPVATVGTRSLIEKNSLRFAPGAMKLVIGDPIPVAGLTLDDVEALGERTRQAIVALKGEIAAAEESQAALALRKAS
jgi:1-acyl-sn-glycerol-3-phosphate acyltransferase